MDPDFWHARWAQNQTAFHEDTANALLVTHIDKFPLSPNTRIFVPLCGKTNDIALLLSRGYRVVGAELSQLAIDQLFNDLGVTPTVTTIGALQHYAAPDLDIYVGDIFDLTAETLGPVDAIYDRAALVALPAQLRDRYAPHLIAITAAAPQLLICFTYDQSIMPGPPHSIDTAEVTRLYDATYTLTPLQTVDVAGGLKGQAPATETIWYLAAK